MQSARWLKEENKVIMAGSQALNPDSSWRLQDGLNMLKENYINMLKAYPDYTFIFEYISIKNRLVVNYSKEEEGLYLIGMRNINDGKHLSYKEIISIADNFNVLHTVLFNASLEEILQNCKVEKGDKREGYVCKIDDYFVKIKTDDYIKLNKILSSITRENAVIKAIADGSFDDLYAKVPDSYKQNVQKIKENIDEYVKITEEKIEKYWQIAPKNNKKEFMIYCNNIKNYCVPFLRAKYLGEDVSILKNRGKYVKMEEIKERL